ncbi:twin-arginine translocation signal domain-containing protein [Xanthomonas campestris]|nr:twin-arginine translocation signal domain-containing protein [Xanthomonas campestris]MEA9577275.1 twin-arginine translocation signal domain-containing protein [Xanthomonas campestris]MEB2113452.1 twin-arginine translocation signal domain-containing protein [Xanthomonas campestris pv. campestris]
MGNRRGFLKMSASLAAAPLIPESTAVSTTSPQF